MGPQCRAPFNPLRLFPEEPFSDVEVWGSAIPPSDPPPPQGPTHCTPQRPLIPPAASSCHPRPIRCCCCGPLRAPSSQTGFQLVVKLLKATAVAFPEQQSAGALRARLKVADCTHESSCQGDQVLCVGPLPLPVPLPLPFGIALLNCCNPCPSAACPPALQVGPCTNISGTCCLRGVGGILILHTPLRCRTV